MTLVFLCETFFVFVFCKSRSGIFSIIVGFFLVVVVLPGTCFHVVTCRCLSLSTSTRSYMTETLFLVISKHIHQIRVHCYSSLDLAGCNTICISPYDNVF